MKKNLFKSGLISILIFIAACSNGKIHLTLENVPETKQVNVLVNGNLFTSYCYSDSLAKPILFPINASNGVTITRGYPLFPRKGESADHPHHCGYWFTYGDVNGINFWANGSWIPDSEKHKMGTIRLKNIEQIENPDDKAILKVNQEWVKDEDGTLVLDEEVVFTFRAGKDYRIIDRYTTLTAMLPEVSFPDTKEGATGLRVARFLDFPYIKPRVYIGADGKKTQETVENDEGVSGNYLSSEGVEGAEVWGTRAKWMNLYGVNNNETISVVFMDHPSSFNYPTYWHARDYGLFTANPFGVKDFTNKKEELNLKLKQGEKISFKHRIYIKAGEDFPAEEIEKEWLNFSID